MSRLLGTDHHLTFCFLLDHVVICDVWHLKYALVFIMHYYEMSTKLSATAKLEDELLEKTFPDWGDKRYMSVDEYKTWIRKRWKEIKDGE